MNTPSETIRATKDKRRFIQSLRSVILNRDNFKCRFCRSEPPLAVIYITPPSLGGATSVENLVTACTKCRRIPAERPTILPAPDRVPFDQWSSSGYFDGEPVTLCSPSSPPTTPEFTRISRLSEEEQLTRSLNSMASGIAAKALNSVLRKKERRREQDRRRTQRHRDKQKDQITDAFPPN